MALRQLLNLGTGCTRLCTVTHCGEGSHCGVINLRNFGRFEQRTLMISADISEYSTNHVTDISVFCKYNFRVISAEIVTVRCFGKVMQ